MGSAFSRAQAANGLKNAKTATLRSALTNYINATKNMNANAIRKALNNKPIGPFGGMSHKNRIANGVANAVAASRGAKDAMAAANAGATPETAAAGPVNKAANAIKNLNAFMNKLKAGSTPESEVNYYRKSGRSVANNRKLNAGRNGGRPIHAKFFNKINSIDVLPKLVNLNKYMNTLSGNNNNKVNKYITNKRNFNANRALNAGRNGGPKYANFFKLVNTKKVGPILAAQTQRQVKAPKYNKNTATQTLLNANVKALSLNNRANLIKAINSKLASTNTKPENKTKLTNKRKNISSIGGTNASFLNVSPELPANNPNTPGLVLKSNKGQVGGVARNVYYVNGSPNRYIKNTNGKYIKLSNGNVNLGTWPAPNANARKVNFDPENGFIQTNTKK
jgi:hypothetical protein